MPTGKSEILVGRRYLDRGFVDDAMRLFLRNVDDVEPPDWANLAESLMERNRVPEVVRVCEAGSVPLPRSRLLLLGDDHLRRRHIDTAIHLYELADADRERWSRVLDTLLMLPERERQAINVVERHLGGDDGEQAEPRLRVVK